MERTVGIFEAKTKLSEICTRVAETGARYVVTRRGREVARIVPVSEKTGKREGIFDATRKRHEAGEGMPDDGFMGEAWQTRTRRFSPEEESG